MKRITHIIYVTYIFDDYIDLWYLDIYLDMLTISRDDIDYNVVMFFVMLLISVTRFYTV